MTTSTTTDTDEAAEGPSTADLHRFDRERAAVERSTIEQLVANANRGQVVRALEAADIGLDPRFVRGGAARVLAPRVRRGNWALSCGIVAHLGAPIMQALFHRVEDEDDLLTPAAVADALPEPVDRVGVPAVRLVFALHAASLAPELAEVLTTSLDEDERLQMPDEDRADAQMVAAGTDDPATSPDEAPATEEDELPGVLEDDVTLFTAIDQVMIKQAVASYTGVVGALSIDDLHRLIDELVKLNTDRRSSYFHLGFVDALDDRWRPALPDEAMNESRRQWFVFGQLSGATRRGNARRIVEVADEDPVALTAVIDHPSQGRSVTRAVTEALLDQDPRSAASVLRRRLAGGHAFTGMAECLTAAHQRARALLAEQEPDAAEALWEALAQAPEDLLDDLAIAARRRLVACARARDDYPTARTRVDELLAASPSPHERAVLETERGLIAAEIPHVRVIQLGATDAHRNNLRARLERGRHHFEAALELEATEWRAALCLGVLLALEGQPDRSAPLLELARSQLEQDTVAANAQLDLEIKFLAALERLRTLEEGWDGRAFKDVRDAIEHPAWTPPANDLVEVLELLALHGSRHATQLLALAADHLPAPKLSTAALQLLERDEPGALWSAARLARSSKVPPLERLGLLTRALDVDPGDEAEVTEELVDVLDDLLRQVTDEEVERRFASWLASSSTASDLFGPLGVLDRRAHLHQRLGEVEAARDLVERMLHRVLATPLPDRTFDAVELLGRHRELDPTGERSQELAGLTEAADARRGPDDGALETSSRTVRLLFVGGDERQADAHAPVEQRLRELVGGEVEVCWVHPGWSSNWTAYAEQAEAKYDAVDALVLMPLVRTNLGRRLRRGSGDAGLPWVACTGHGRDSMARALATAARVARATG
jgi:hypothetical protein